MSFKSFLSAAGHDFVSVFNWLGSAKGQATISGVETAANVGVSVLNPALGASLAAVEGLFNAGLKSILGMEASAAAVGAQSGTGAQKAAAVTANLAPQAEAFLQSIGVSAPTATEVQTLATAISGGLVSILNAIPAPPAP